MSHPTRRLVLIGGARSGKSHLATEVGRAWGTPVTVLATATAGDDDMARRIRLHQRERPAEWATVEAPTDLATAIDSIPTDQGLVVDCLTMWTANELLARCPAASIVAEAAAAARTVMARTGPAVVITNEVGSGVVPATVSGREYRDLLGRVNRAFADRLDATYLVTAGQLTRLEPAQDVLPELGARR